MKGDVETWGRARRQLYVEQTLDVVVRSDEAE